MFVFLLSLLNSLYKVESAKMKVAFQCWSPDFGKSVFRLVLAGKNGGKVVFRLSVFSDYRSFGYTDNGLEGATRLQS